MGSNAITPRKLLSAGDMSAATVVTSSLDISYLDNVAFQANFTGSPTGTFSVEGSVDRATWTAIPLNASPAAAGSAATVLIELVQLSSPYVRLKYTKGSGTGSLDVWASAKDN